MKRTRLLIAGLLLLGNFVVFEWIAWRAWSGQLSPTPLEEEAP